METGSVASHSPDPWRRVLSDAARFWEPRRVIYNLLLTAVVVIWLVASWPHFRPAFTLQSLLFLAFMALGANLCYSAAYLADIPLQGLMLGPVRSRWRWGLWLLGTLLAIVFENYWIADEIYPFV